MIISNELVGVDITLNYSSHFGYNTMGFDTSTVTQDCDNADGYFGIRTHCPIPVLQYGNSFTWAKYCYMVLHPDMIRQMKTGVLIYQFNVQHKPKSKIWKDMSQIPCILLRSCSRSCIQPLTVSMTQTVNQCKLNWIDTSPCLTMRKKGQKKDTHLICGMELALNYQTNQMNH